MIDPEKRGNSKLTIGHGGAIMHLTAALFNYATGLNITLVTYKGTGPVVTDLLGAHIPLGIIDIPSAEAALASGKVRALAISSSQRFEGLPDLRTFQEAGLKDFESIGFLGMLAPAGVPPDALATIDRASRPCCAIRRFWRGSIVRQPADDDRSKEFGDFIASEIKKWTAVVDAAICARNDQADGAGRAIGHEMKRTILAVAMLTAFGGLQSATAQDTYPNRLIKLIVPFAPGGNTDVVGRVTAD